MDLSNSNIWDPVENMNVTIKTRSWSCKEQYVTLMWRYQKSRFLLHVIIQFLEFTEFPVIFS